MMMTYILTHAMPMEDLIEVLDTCGIAYEWAMDELFITDEFGHRIAVTLVNGTVDGWELVG